MEDKYLLVMITIGFVSGNYIYQWLIGDENWREAGRISFFQILIVLAVYVVFFF